MRAFLEDRRMMITIDGHSENQVPILVGSLGCLLYCVTTQRLTKDLRGTEEKGPAVFMYVDYTTLVDVVRTDKAALHFTTNATKSCFKELLLERDFSS